MTDERLALRATAALAVGAFVLHQLRYVLGYGAAYSDTLAAHGHGYLAVVTPLIALVAAVAAGQFLAAIARAGSTGRGGRSAGRLPRVWLAASAVLFAAYAGQELAEGALSAGHPGGLAAVLGGGGWWALPLALALGLLVALVMRGAEAVLTLVARRRAGAARRRAHPAARPVPVDLPSLGLLGRNLAGRAPPLASV